jgi:NADPH:quinone reductase
MRSLLCRALGPADGLAIEETPAPAVEPGRVVVRVEYAALNFMDTLIVAGKYQVKPTLPFSPAGEFSGVVASTAHDSGFEPGDRVVGFCGYGAAREEISVEAGRLARLPDGLASDVAAGLPVAYGTTLHALRQRAALSAGETLVVLGASGGVGLAAVEIGAALGARVIACASSEAKAALAQSLGANETINYAARDLRTELKRLCGERGADVVYDPVGGALTEPALRSLGWGGRLLVIGFASGDIPRIPLNLPLLKGCSIVGVFFGDFVAREPAVNARNMATLLQWAAEGRIARHPPTVYPLDDFREAFAAIADRRARGKVVLKI